MYPHVSVRVLRILFYLLLSGHKYFAQKQNFWNFRPHNNLYNTAYGVRSISRIFFPHPPPPFFQLNLHGYIYTHDLILNVRKDLHFLWIFQYWCTPDSVITSTSKIRPVSIDMAATAPLRQVNPRSCQVPSTEIPVSTMLSSIIYYISNAASCMTVSATSFTEFL